MRGILLVLYLCFMGVSGWLAIQELVHGEYLMGGYLIAVLLLLLTKTTGLMEGNNDISSRREYPDGYSGPTDEDNAGRSDR